MTPASERSELPRAGAEGLPPQGDVGEIQARIESLAQAIRNKNVDQVLSHYAPDVVAYDLLPPLDVRGIAAYRKNFEKWFASMAGRMSYDMLDVHIAADMDHAYAHCLSHVTGARTGGGRADYWVRVTSGWRKSGGQWVIAHEHISMPAVM